VATYNLRRSVKSFTDCNYNFNILNWLLINLDNINVDGETLTVKAANVKGTLTAEQIIVGATTNFEEGYNPYDKADAADLAAVEAYANQRAAEVQQVAENIANGLYPGTFIDGKHIYSPIISGQDAYFEGTISIGNGKFGVDYQGNLTAASGNFYIPWNGDGVYNSYAPYEETAAAARWKHSKDSYLYHSEQSFAIHFTNKGAVSRVWPNGNAWIQNNLTVDGTLTAGGLNVNTLNLSGTLSVGGNITLGGNLIKGTSGERVNIYTKTTATNSWSWMEFWDYSTLSGRSGEACIGADHHVWRTGSNGSSSGTERMRLTSSLLTVGCNVRTDGVFQVGTATGITQEVLYTDRLEGARTMQFTGGILTRWN